jgi:arylsulfatase
VVLADDLGFSDLSCYGGEIATPNLDRLAAEGVRFTQFYNTARCWPTRGALLTGYYAQQVNRDPAGARPKWAALLPELLREAGYRSYHSGKWHIDGKPTGNGFDRSYRFEDWDRYFTPVKHFLDERQLPQPAPGDGYYATTAIADHAIEFLQEHAADHAEAPFFLYLAYIAPHFPLHAPAEDVQRYEGQYEQGWDAVREARWRRLRELGIVAGELSARDAEFTPRYLKPDLLQTVGPGEVDHALPWDELTAEQQRFQAMKMSIHAAMVDRMDRETGRVFDQLRRMNAWDDTLVIFLSDNGADASLLVRGEGHDQNARPGSAESFLCLGPGWASAANAPFRRHKIWVHEGGISTPGIVRWPRTEASEAPVEAPDGDANLRHAPAHVIDFVPTALELAGLENPERWHGADRPPLPGKSLTPTQEADAALQRDELYWHHEGNRAIRVGDWKLVSERENDARWELYDLKTDRIESNNLAEQQPERVKEMAERWQRLDDEFRRQAK